MIFDVQLIVQFDKLFDSILQLKSKTIVLHSNFQNKTEFSTKQVASNSFGYRFRFQITIINWNILINLSMINLSIHQICILYNIMKEETLIRMKDQLETIRMRKNNLKNVPTPEIIPIFNHLHQKEKKLKRMANMREQIAKLKKWLAQHDTAIEREQKAYEQRQQILKQQLHIHKAFVKNLTIKYQQTRKSYQQVQLIKTLIAAFRRCYLFRLAQIFLNDSARSLFKDYISSNNIKQETRSIMSSDSNQQLSGTTLSYSMLLVYCICRIYNINLLHQYVFRGSKSYIISAQRGDVVPLYRNMGRSIQNAIKLCQIDISQVFDILGVDRKIKKVMSFKQQMDLLSQYLICTDIQEISKSQ